MHVTVRASSSVNVHVDELVSKAARLTRLLNWMCLSMPKLGGGVLDVPLDRRPVGQCHFVGPRLELEAESEQVGVRNGCRDIGTDPRTTHFLPGLEDCVGLVGAQRLQPVSGVDPGQARADHDDIEIGAHESSVEYPHPWWALNLLERCLRAPYHGKYNSTGVNGFDNGCFDERSGLRMTVISITIRQNTSADTNRTDFALAA